MATKNYKQVSVYTEDYERLIEFFDNHFLLKRMKRCDAMAMIIEKGIEAWEKVKS